MKHEFTLTLSPKRKQLAWIYLFFELLILPTILLLLGIALGTTSESTLNLLYYLINFVVCLILFAPMLRQSLRIAAEAPLSTLGTAISGFLLLQLTNILMGFLILYVYPDFSNVNDAAVAGLITQQPLLMGLCVSFLVPVAEECLFRGLLFAPLYRQKPLAAYLLSVLFFSAIHVVGYIGLFPVEVLLLCFVQYIPAAWILCYALARTNSLAAPILIHCAVNFMSIFTLR